MKHINNKLVALFVGLMLIAGSAAAKTGNRAPKAPAPEVQVQEMPSVCPHQAMPMELSATKAYYLPNKRAFVMIDSIDCAVDVLLRQGDSAVRVGRYTTDVFKGRHDLKNILRPVSVNAMDDKLFVLASSVKDSSYLAVINIADIMDAAKANDSLKEMALVSFSCASFAFQIDPMNGEIVIAGKNPVGYDINIVSYDNNFENLTPSSKFHYHVPKQSERIQASDPIGVGLTVVAVCVVFFALVCICFIMKGYGAAIMKVQDRKSNKVAAKNHEEAPAKSKDVSGEVYAAIAAAIYAYDQDMHDEEDTIITIQKVERAWTPWNAKFYNMNKYFSNRK